MILFINGFVPQHFAAHEVVARNGSCYGAAGATALASPIVALGAGAYCLSRSFQKEKNGPIYQPSRTVTATMPTHKGEAFDYWKGIAKQVSTGFRDDRMFFINGSSDNRSTGTERFKMGYTIGEHLLQTWHKKDAQVSKMEVELRKIDGLSERVGREFDNATDISRPLQEYFNITRQGLEQQMQLSAKDFVLQKNESLKIVGHSMGAAMAAGIATAIAADRTYRDRLEMVWYLAPHQPQEIVHPQGVVGFQSSSRADRVASLNEQSITVPNLYKRVVAGDSSATVTMSVSIEWAKGKTAYVKIANVQHFIENSTIETDRALGGHAVTSYDDEIAKFFQLYTTKN